MTTRERFLTVMSLGTPDRVPYFEEGLRKAVLKAWQKQGLSSNKELAKMFSTDHFEEIAPELNPIPEFDIWPSTIEDLNLLEDRLDPNESKRFVKGWKKHIDNCQKNNDVIFYRVHRGLFLSLGVHNWNRFIDVIELLFEDPDYVHRVLTIQAEFAATILENTLKHTNFV